MFYKLDVNIMNSNSFLIVFNKTNKLLFNLDKIKKTLGEGTFGKVVEVKDLRE